MLYVIHFPRLFFDFYKVVKSWGLYNSRTRTTNESVIIMRRNLWLYVEIDLKSTFWRVWWVKYLTIYRDLWALIPTKISHISVHEILMSQTPSKKDIMEKTMSGEREIEIQGCSFRENSMVKVFPFYKFVMHLSRTISRTRKHDKRLMESLVSMHELLSCNDALTT